MIGQRPHSGLESTPAGVVDGAGLGSVPLETGAGGWIAPLETQAVGGSPELVVLVFLALLVATALSVYLAVRLYRGYRAGGGVGMLLLGSGLVLLTTIPMLLRLVLSNTPAVDPVWQEVIATAVQLLGLLVILGVVYGRR